MYHPASPRWTWDEQGHTRHNSLNAEVNKLIVFWSLLKVQMLADQAKYHCTFSVISAILIQDYWSNFPVSDYRPSDFKQVNGSRQIGAMMDTHLADQLSELTQTRGTSLFVDYDAPRASMSKENCPRLRLNASLCRFYPNQTQTHHLQHGRFRER
jgi:hypothetical protein